MRRKLLFAIAALLCSVGSWAQGTWSAPAVPGSDISSTNTGNYAIYNIKADAIMGEGMNYNTEAIACRAEGNITGGLAARQKFTLTVVGSTVKMVHVNHTDRGVGCASKNANDVYADYASNNVWTFAASANYANAYTLTLAEYGTLDVDDKWGGKLTIKDGKGYTDWAFIPEGSITDGSFAKWKERKAMYEVYQALVASSSTSTYSSALETANAVYNNSSASASELRAATRTLILATAAGIEQTTNVSALFTNADIQACGSKNDWSSDNIDISAGAAENHWASTAITLTQEQTDVPNGMYTLIFHGMYRTGEGDAPYFKAVSGENNSQVNLPLMSDMASRWSVRGTDEWAGADNSKIPNKLWRAAEGLAYEGASAKISSFKVSGNTLSLTVKVTSTAQWVPFQGFEIFYEGPTNLTLYKEIQSKKATAQDLLSVDIPEGVYDALDDAIKGTEGLTALSSEDDLSDALEALETAIGYYDDTKDVYPLFCDLYDAADAIADVAYEETTSGSHTTFTTAISTQYAAAEAATTASAINTAISTLKAAIKAYVNGAEPTGGASFEITCLVENPSFDNNTIDGWTRTNSGGGNAVTSYTCNEFWNNTFNFYQDLAGLPNGSYQLSVQAYCRPGDNGNLTNDKKAYYDYTQNINNVHAELYVNSDASKVGNIYAYKDATTAKYNPGDWTSDYECVVDGGTNYFVPNSMAGASKYFADENVYKTEVAALVTDGNLRIGFRDETLTTSQWTIFDNFRLFYYGSDKLVYYKQYLPQLRTEVSADLSNGAYANVLVSSEDEALDAALAADPASETEEAYETVINALKDAQTAFRAAASSYDAMVAAKASSLTKISDNIGTGVFQYNETTNNSLYSAYEDAQDAVDDYAFTTSSTAAGAQALVDALDDAIDNYNNQPLNAPDADTHYNIVVATTGHAKLGNAVVLDRMAEYPHYNGSYVDNNTGFTLSASAAPNVNLAQACVFTAVAGKVNTYYISTERTEGTVYWTYGSLNDSKVNWKESQIQATTESSKKGEFKIVATTTANVFNIVNTTAAGGTIACQAGGSLYTEAGNADFTLAEASQASVPVNLAAGKYGTRIFPFTPSAIDGITYYSCETINESDLKLDIVEVPAANTPYILYASKDVDETLEGWGTAATTSYESGLLTGIYNTTTIAADAHNYVLQTLNGVQAFYLVKENFTNTQPYRAYITYEAPVEVKALNFIFDELPTAVNSIEAAQNENAVIYNLAGQRLSKAQKGVNIINGKKVLVK